MQNTEKETLVFKTGSFSTWLIYLLAILALAVYVLLIHYMHSPPEILLWTLLFLGLAVAVGSVILHLRLARLTITEADLRISGAFSVKTIPFEQIKGFYLEQGRVGGALRLILVHGLPRKIGLGFKDAPFFLIALEKHIPNLSRLQREADLREIFRQPALGDTTSPEEKAATVRRLRKVCRAVNYAAVALAVWAFAYPHPYKELIWTLVAFPIPALLMLRRFEGVIRFYPRQGSIFPRLDGAFIFPALCLTFRGALDWHPLDWHSLLPPFATLVLICGILFLAAVRELRRTAAGVALFGITLLFYAFGTVNTLNGMLAESPATAYRVEVKAKHTEQEKITLYYLTVTPWRDRSKLNDIMVTEEVYQRANPGDSVEIQVRTGKFDIPFYQVR